MNILERLRAYFGLCVFQLPFDFTTISGGLSTDKSADYGYFALLANVQAMAAQIGNLPAWITPVLLNGFTNQGAGFSTAQYYKSAANVVYLKGFLLNGGSGLTVFVLPAGFRPSETRVFPASATAFGFVTISNAGAVVYTGSANCCLDGINFLGEQ